jgi:site-specific DNA-methyltransferase (adenine-specific)
VSQSTETVRVGGGCLTGKGKAVPNLYHIFDDSKPPTEEYFKELERVSKHRIIWGGNYFLDYLGATQCMIFWDKGRRGMNFADGEIAWTDFKEPCRILEYKWNGMLQEDMTNKEYRIHPTQKPVNLYKWLLRNYAKEGDKILDTHVGSASSLIACHQMGFDFVGFELDEVYYKESKERLETAQSQITIDDLLRDVRFP